jgi:hypothetical protein
LIWLAKKFGIYNVVVQLAATFVASGKTSSPEAVGSSSEIDIGFLGIGVPNRAIWHERLLAVRNAVQSKDQAGVESVIETKPPKHQPPEIAVIVSLYKTDRFLSNFVKVLESQTALEKSEICIISVKPSLFERNHLEALAKKHSNVILEFHEERTPIYVAWNRAIELTSAPIVTNANVDDIRSPNSLEIQIDAFKRYPWADVIYQDVIVSYDPDATWDELAELGSETNFPHVFHGALLAGFNYPHNAPAWKRELHQSVGPFNESYSSAADGEFWLRCSESGKKFFKINSIHNSYYINPEGLSSSSNAVGPMEHAKILTEFSKRNEAHIRKMPKTISAKYESKQLALIKQLKELRAKNG